jgi:flagellar basal-body rod modification protein FlgD
MTTAVNPYESLGVAAPVQGAAKQTLGQEDFFKLMTTQLQSQDPFKPMDASQFLGQIAQFSTVSGIQSLNTGFATLAENLTANQALQGASLVGRSVQVPGSTMALGDTGNVTATALLPSSGAVKVSVRNAAGVLVREIDLGNKPAGTFDLSWDGLDSKGNRAAAGNYTLDVRATLADGSQEALQTAVVAPVTAVRLGAQGLQVEVAGVGSVPLASVIQIR